VSGLREKIGDLVDAISRNEVSEPTDAVLRVLAEHGGVTNLREQISLMIWRSANARAERAEADLAAARQQLDQVRAAVHESKQWDERGYPVTDSSTLFAILNARPASTTGGD
jgi:hypothetical protein